MRFNNFVTGDTEVATMRNKFLKLYRYTFAVLGVLCGCVAISMYFYHPLPGVRMMSLEVSILGSVSSFGSALVLLLIKD